MIAAGVLPADVPPDFGYVTDAAQKQAQERLAKLVPNAKHISNTNSGHEIHKEQPQLVIDSIRKVVEAVRTGSQAQAGKIEATYVVLGADGTVARAILSDATECPMIDVGGAAERMNIRAPADAAFPVLVCETMIPPATTSAAIGGRVLPLPKPTFATIAAFGDTGCRLKAARDSKKGRRNHDHPEAGIFQDCDSQSKWPFSRLSATVAAQKPDLVIHVGDYLYRESPCPEGDKGCEGSPYGDDWSAWQADFFRPAVPLLAAAPWIMVRGNHEICARAGLGFFRFLYPEPARDHAPPACTDFLAPYTVEMGGKPFLIIDSSDADDSCADNMCDSAPYAAQFASLKAKPGTWLLSHRPIWAIGWKFTLNQTLQQALRSLDGRLPPGSKSFCRDIYIHSSC